ncbi:MAG: hypothetical protein OXG98_19325 [Gemmatimonadetes bacterium]|nr:hypothetical protein [Gemmatimonadota bacterium]
MKYRLHLTVLGLIVTAFIASDAVAQRGGFGRGGGRGQNSAMMERMQAVSTFPVDRIWHVLSIRMDTTDEQVLQLRAVVKEASSQKEALVAQATKTGDWSWLREQLEANENQFKEKLKGTLSADDIKTLEKMVEEASRMMPGRSGRSRR